MRILLTFVTTVLLVALVSSVSFSAPVRSMLGADGSEFVESEPLSAADYIQDGLVCMFDGIENVDWGIHDSDATTWTDLVGGRTTTWLSDASNSLTWENGGLRRVGTKGITATVPWLANIKMGTKYTIELVMGDDSATSTYGINNYWYFDCARHFFYAPKSDKRLVDYTGSVFNELLPENFSFAPHTFAIACDGTNYDASRMEFRTHIDGDFLRTGHCTVSSATTMYLFGRARDWPDTRDTTIYAVRIYSRGLSDNELKYNHLVDRLRFNLP